MLKRASSIFRLLARSQRCIHDVKKPFEFNVKDDLIRFCEKTFDLPTYKVQSMMLRWPKLQSIKESQIIDSMECLKKIGFDKQDVLEMPYLLNFYPATLKSRYSILKECGITNLSIETLSRYVTIIVKKTIKELKNEKLLPSNINIQDELIKSFSLYPDIQKKLHIQILSEDTTLYEMRMDILQQFLFYKIHLPKISFQKMMDLYTAMKHKPLANICENINYLENVLKFSTQKILSYKFVLSIDIENINNYINEVKEIGGLDIPSVFKKCPRLMFYDYKKTLKMKKVLKDENIPNEVQAKCIQIFLLSPETVIDRLNQIRNHPELKNLLDNARILSVVFFINKVMKRLKILQQMNKKCSSLHKLVSSNEEFNRYAKSFGDGTRGYDIVNTLALDLPDNDANIIRQMLMRHQYWLHVPLSNVMKTFEFLKTKFSDEEIFKNFQIILYPVEDVMDNLSIIDRISKSCKKQNKNEVIKLNIDSEKLIYTQINIDELSRSQVLSLLLYILEKNYHFTGNGVWTRQLLDYKISHVI